MSMSSFDLQESYLTESRGEVQQAVVAQVQAEEMPQLLLDEDVVQQAGQRVQLVS